MKIRSFISTFISLLVTASALLLPGAPSVASAAALTISVSRTPLSLPFYVAESEGFFAAEGVQIKLSEVIGGHRSMQQLLDGEADLATTSEAVIMFNSFKRSDYAIIATFVSSDDDIKLVTKKGTAITRPEQLAGRRVGTVLGAASHYYLDTLLLFHGVDPKKVEIIGLQPEAMALALRKNEVDAIAIWEPYPFKAISGMKDARVVKNASPYVLSFNLVAHKKHLGARDGDLVKVLRALDRAQRFIHEEPLKAQALLRSRLQLDQAFINWIWPRYHYQLRLDQSLLSTLESEARWARQEGHVTEKRAPDYLDYIYSKPLRGIQPAAVGIVE